MRTPLDFPLSGVRVLDLTRLVPGAFATLMLAELGAEVIKIEDPRGGDPMRSLPPRLDGRGVYDRLLNRGKKSVALDLRSPDGQAGLARLLETAEVVIESFRPATARRLGVDAATLRAGRPRLVHCAITGYGQTGPYAERPGHDLNYVALSGVLAANHPERAALPRIFLADVGGGAMHAVAGILAALVAAGRRGDGASLDISMHEAALYWVMLPAAAELVDGAGRAEGELPTFGAHASYNVYRTKDGRELALGALELKFWRAFCDAVGRPDLVSRHATDPADQAALRTEVAGIFASRTAADWLAHFDAHDVCLTPVNTPAEALRDPHVLVRGAIAATPGGRTVRPPFVTRMPDLAEAPVLGQHTAELLG